MQNACSHGRMREYSESCSINPLKVHAREEDEKIGRDVAKDLLRMETNIRRRNRNITARER